MSGSVGISYWRYGTAYKSHLQGQAVQLAPEDGVTYTAIKAWNNNNNNNNIIIIIIIINCNWIVTRWQWLFYMYTKYEAYEAGY